MANNLTDNLAQSIQQKPQSTMFTDLVNSIPWVKFIADEEHFEASEYPDPGNETAVQGYGHTKTDRWSRRGFADPDNITIEEGSKVLVQDVVMTKGRLMDKYPDADIDLINWMTPLQFQYSPEGFDDKFGKGLRDNDIPAIRKKLITENVARINSGKVSLSNRWGRLSTRLGELEARRNEQ